ncbi:MAG: hypothetical protein ACFFD2_13070 [Promethearchaeota archaeon]
MRKEKYFVLLFSIVLLTLLLLNVYLILRFIKFPDSKINLSVEKDQNQIYYQNFDKFGYVKIHNITIDRTIAEIGENITVSTVYSLKPNESYAGSGRIGLYNQDSGWLIYENSLIDGVEFYNVTEIFSIDPNLFDAFDTCQGRVEIEITNIFDPWDFMSTSNKTNEVLELRKANLNYSIIEQNPLTIFSEDILNFSLLIHNEHTKKYISSNNYIEFNIFNENKSFNFSKYTNSNGILNFSVNCSSLGVGNFTIQFKTNETSNYESTTHILQLEVLDEASSINCSLLNSGQIYPYVYYDNSNYSKALYLIHCEFNANISWNSTFGNGQFSKFGNYYNATILSPNTTGTYQIHFVAQPITTGKTIEFDKDLQVERRPIELFPIVSLSENESLINFQITVIDKLTNHAIIENNSINLLATYNDSNWEFGPIMCNSSGIATFTWNISNETVGDYVNLEFVFNETPIYQLSSIIRNFTIRNFDEFGYVKIHTITIDKTIAEIGENVTISIVYSLKPNESYAASGRIGLYNQDSGWLIYKNILIEVGEFYNITEIISIEPNLFDVFDTCEGRAEIEIFNIFDPWDFMSTSNKTNEVLEFKKANLNYSIIEQYPLTIFSENILNFSLLIHNEHTKKYISSNNYIEFNISNENKSFNFSKYTNSNGILNFSVNCSSLGVGNFTIQFKTNETSNYESTTHILQLEVLDEASSINCSLLNSGQIYPYVYYDNSNYSKAFYLIQCEFDANISWYSTFGNGQFSKFGNYYNTTILSPNTTGTYQIHFVVQPIETGKLIEFDKDLQVKRRPIEFFSIVSRSENQSLINFQITIIDKLQNHSIIENNLINVLATYNNSNWEFGPIMCNSSGTASFTWNIPNKIVEDYVNFEFVFNNTPIYQFTSTNRNLIITNLEYLGPFDGISGRNITLKAKLSTLNGNNLSNQSILLRIDDIVFNLTTNLNGEIIYSFIAPSYSTNLKIEIEYLGSENVLSFLLKLDIEIKLDLFHKIWNSLGYILIGISITIALMLFLKKFLTKRNLSDINVD